MAEKFYLYLDNFSFSDCYSTNTIFCEAAMPNAKGVKTISRNTQDYLFLTHKKLAAKSRLTGIAGELTCWPVTMELAVDSMLYERFPVVFVKSDGEAATLEYGDIRDYNAAYHWGCYVFSALPFSAVSRILFETQDQAQDADKSMFPDFWWREDIVSVIDQDEFSDTVSLAFTDGEIAEKIPCGRLSQQESWLTNKYQAAILQMVNGTRQWVAGKHQTTFDPFLLQFFAIDSEKVKAELARADASVLDDVFQYNLETLALIPELSVENDITNEQGVYNAIVQTIIENCDKCSPAVVDVILCAIMDKLSHQDAAAATAYEASLKEIKACAKNAMGYSLENTLQHIQERHGDNSVLKALFFTMKNPGEFEKFDRSLSVYKVDSLTCRRAMVLWGFLNGTMGIPARGFNRDNLKLWKSIEWACGRFSKSAAAVKAKAPGDISPHDLGLEIHSEEIIMLEEVHTFLIEDKKRVTKPLLRDIYAAAKNLDRKLSKEDPYCRYAITTENFLSLLPQPANSLMTKAEIDAYSKAFTKKCKDLFSGIKKKPQIEYEAIYNDWISNKSNFEKVWGIVEDRLKAFYIEARGSHE